jgi:hypothetical protein
MAQNKTSKYFKYAFGEIILVVIGILIALQISNWNEQKKIRFYELTMLQEVKDALDIDHKNLNNRIDYLEKVSHSFHSLAIIKNNSESSTDSLMTHLKTISEYGYVFNINSSPYDAIKSGGLDKISNASIRHQLSNLYGFEIPQTESWINEVLRVELFNRNDLFENLFYMKAIPNNGRVEREIVIKDSNTIYNNPEFDKLLNSSWPLNATINRLESISAKMTELKANINLELKL